MFHAPVLLANQIEPLVSIAILGLLFGIALRAVGALGFRGISGVGIAAALAIAPLVLLALVVNTVDAVRQRRCQRQSTIDRPDDHGAKPKNEDTVNPA